MVYGRTDTCHPTSTDLKRFRAILLARQRKILGNVFSMESEALRRSGRNPSVLPNDSADLSTESYELESTLGLVGSERDILAEIEEALTIIQNGTYGVCEGDGQHIPRARLRAIPWTRYCVRCASLNERGILYRESALRHVRDRGETTH